MKSAWMLAGLKIGLGCLLVAAVLGVRIVSISPRAGSSETGPNAEPSESPTAGVEVQRVPAEEESSLLDRVATGLQDSRPEKARDSERSGDRMVSCQMRSGTQFMTADDCSMRGGSATIFEAKR